MKQVTLCNLRDCTEQEVFDFVSHHLLTQGKQSLDKKSANCMYRNGEGLSCAVGCMMTDQEYQPTFEGQTWYRLSESGLVPRHHRVLIDALQILHDTEPPRDWKFALARLASNRSLRTDILENFSG